MYFSLMHNSRDIEYRRPFGAVPCGTAVQLSLDVEELFAVDQVRLRTWSTASGEKIYNPVLVTEEHSRKRYVFETDVAKKPGLIWYHFIVEAAGRTLWFGAPSDGLGGVGVSYDSVPADWQITVYDAAVKVPSWYTHGIMYQIFPDRFYRGDKQKELPELPVGSLYHRHWDDFPFYAKDPQTGNIAAYDFFGGTLEGIVDKMTYLKSLGVSILYLNPIFESVSNHKYDTGDYKKVDPQFGGEEGLERLRTAADSAGIRLILDGVFSHTGSDSPYFQDAIRSKDSPYYPWYQFSEYPAKYDCWWGVTTLPNVNEMEASYRDFIISNPDSVIKHWLRRGISGWRLDVVDELPGAFVQEMYRELKKTNPEAILIGEVWEDASHKESYGVLREYLWGHELDSVINYPFRSAVIDYFTGKRSASDAMRELASLAENYPGPYFYSTMNVLGTHDVQRILTLLGGAPVENELTKLEQARYHLPAAKRALAIKRLKLASLVQFASPGVPCIYYGDEAGVEGHSDPQNRRTYPWGKESRELLSWYRKLGALRTAEPVLQTGRWIPLDAGPEVFAFGRRTDSGRDALGEVMNDAAFVILVNRSEVAQKCRLDVAAVCAGPMADIFADEKTEIIYTPDDKGMLHVSIAPFTAIVLKASVHEIFASRSAGILLHPTSLPGPHGIGDIGPAAHAFVEWLAAAGQKFWQLLPLNPVDGTGSPYQSSSAFAGNTLLISPDELRERGLLDQVENPAGLSCEKVEYVTATAWKMQLLRTAFEKFRQSPEPEEYRQFCREAGFWLEDYALFMALKEAHAGKAWTEWEPGARKRKPAALRRYRRELAVEIDFHRFAQFIFYGQWQTLHRRAAAKNIKIVGDLPIFVAHDSADVWASPHLFALDRFGRPKTKAGVPPDYFSRTGQLWGNPHYDWPAHAKEDYAWWSGRMRWLLGMVDTVRVDHFRGFEAFWSVSARCKTAIHGKWVKGPGRQLFQALQRQLGKIPILAEDLGVITDEVVKLKEAFFLPGMTVLPFSIWRESTGFRLPEPEPNSFYYTGTHDNDTLFGWLKSIRTADPGLYAAVTAYADEDETIRPHRLVRSLIDAVLKSEARVAVIPVQDWLGLGEGARMNCPSTCNGNWCWRLAGGELTPKLARQVWKMVHRAKRC